MLQSWHMQNVKHKAGCDMQQMKAQAATYKATHTSKSITRCSEDRMELRDAADMVHASASQANALSKFFFMERPTTGFFMAT